MRLASSIAVPLTAIVSLLTQATALTFTSPKTGDNIDSTEPFTITWTTTPSDPSTISLNIANNNPSLLSFGGIIATDIETSAGSYTAPRGGGFGTGYVIQALSGSGGPVIATSGTFTFSGGAAGWSTLANGQTSEYVTSTANTAAASPNTSLAPTVSPAEVNTGVTASASAGSNSATGNPSPTLASGSKTGLITSTIRSKQTSLQQTITSSSAATAVSSSSTGLAVARPTIRKEIVIGAMGFVAGAVAVLV